MNSRLGTSQKTFTRRSSGSGRLWMTAFVLAFQRLKPSCPEDCASAAARQCSTGDLCAGKSSLSPPFPVCARKTRYRPSLISVAPPPHSFYPGMAAPVNLTRQIEAGAADLSRTDAIEGPSSGPLSHDQHAPELGTYPGRVREGRVRAGTAGRAPRVVGSLNHDVLPMPPVCAFRMLPESRPRC